MTTTNLTTTEKVLYERRLEKIFDMLLLGMTNEEIASHLQITIRSVNNYKKKLEFRYMQYQKQKNENTWALEFAILKNRLLMLYRNLNQKITDNRTSAGDAARVADVALKIALNIIDMENKGIGAIQEMIKLANHEEAKLNQYNNWNELNDEQKRLTDFKRYDYEQNRQF